MHHAASDARDGQFARTHCALCQARLNEDNLNSSGYFNSVISNETTAPGALVARRRLRPLPWVQIQPWLATARDEPSRDGRLAQGPI